MLVSPSLICQLQTLLPVTMSCRPEGVRFPGHGSGLFLPEPTSLCPRKQLTLPVVAEALLSGPPAATTLYPRFQLPPCGPSGLPEKMRFSLTLLELTDSQPFCKPVTLSRRLSWPLPCPSSILVFHSFVKCGVLPLCQHLGKCGAGVPEPCLRELSIWWGDTPTDSASVRVGTGQCRHGGALGCV